MHPVFYVPAGDVLPILFSTYGKTNGESITLTGLAVTDIEIYKDASTTQRASDAGYTLLDTDGIDFDSITGIHGFSIDTGDNTDSGFYTVGAWFHVVVSAVTVDSQTVNFIAAAFRIMPAESVAGKPKVDVDAFGGSAGTFASGIPEVKVASIAANAITASAIASDAITDAKVASDVTIASVTGAVGSVTGNVGGNVTGSVGSVAGAVGSVTGNVGGSVASVASGGITAASFAANAITAAKLDPDVTTELQAGLATASALATVDTVVDAIKAVTDLLPDGGALTSLGETAADIADAVWEEALADHEGTAGSTAEALASAGGSGASAADIADAVWDEILTGHTTPDSAGDTLANVATGTPPTAAAIADAVWDEATSGHTTSGTFGEQTKTDVDAILAKTAQLTFTVSNRVDSTTQSGVSTLDAAGIRTAVGLGSANLDTQLDALPTASEVWAAGTRTLTSAANITSTGGTTVPQTGDAFARLGAPAGASVSADIADLPTNAELATSQAAADDATLAAIAARPSAATIAAAVLTAATANPIDANLQEINDVTLVGDGNGTPWGPA